MEFLTEFGEVWANEQARHAMLVHLPIVMSLLCMVVAVASAISKGKVAHLHNLALILTFVLMLTAYTAQLSGHEAEEIIEGSLSESADHVLEEHEELGEKLWFFGLGGCGLLLVGRFKKDQVKMAFGWAAAVLSVVTAGWAANIAHYGGELVYEYGVVTGSEEHAAIPAFESDDADPRVRHFQQNVLPVISGICWNCHNPERKDRSGDLDQTQIVGLLTGGESGPAIIPGKPDESLLMEALSWTNPDLQMPPKKQLPADQIAAIRKWIADGAVWKVADAPSPEGGKAAH